MDWKAMGACRGEDTDLFFPEYNKADSRPKKFCTVCVVRAQCLDEALRNQEWGVWGGTNERERRVILRRYYRGSATRYGQALAHPGQTG